MRYVSRFWLKDNSTTCTLVIVTLLIIYLGAFFIPRIAKFDDSPKIVWSMFVNGSIAWHPFKINDSRFIVLHGLETINATMIDASTGEILSSRIVCDGSIVSAFAIGDIDGVILIVSDNDSVVALNLTNLTRIWSTNTSQEILDIIPLINSSQIAIITQGEILVINASTGEFIKNLIMTITPLDIGYSGETDEIYILEPSGVRIISLKNQSQSFIPLNHDISDATMLLCSVDNTPPIDILILLGNRILILKNRYETIELELTIEEPYALGDIDADGNLEFVFTSTKEVLDKEIRALDLYRLKLEELSFHLNYVCVESIVLADINGDHNLEMIVTGGNANAFIDETTNGGIGAPPNYDPHAAFIAIIEYREGEVGVYEKELSLFGEILVLKNSLITRYHANGLLCMRIPMQNTLDVFWPHKPASRCLLEFDIDSDMLSDTYEKECQLNPHDPDTDMDTLPDGWEHMNNLNPLDPKDAMLDNDNDGLNNIAEYKYGGDPWDSDTDDDGLSDYDEAQIGTDLRLNDTDGDGYSDGYEVSHGTDPLDPDDYPAPLIVRYWWVPMVCVAVTVVLVVFLYRHRVLVRKVET